ncbi:MAG: hypothetical protein ACF8CQ_14140 [Rhodopirellula sp. JB044]|uniref:hypothetical protein n=1 Tax=Rhodopirellula sp. JB044 TaxID=3342844 RepID=UPI003709DB63
MSQLRLSWFACVAVLFISLVGCGTSSEPVAIENEDGTYGPQPTAEELEAMKNAPAYSKPE